MERIRIYNRAYVNGYQSAYSWASDTHEGYCYILEVTLEHIEENRNPNKDFIAGLRDGAVMGARDRARPLTVGKEG